MKQIRLILPTFFDPFLRPDNRADSRTGPITLDFKGLQSVKHLVESLGIPHTEIAGIKINGKKVELGYHPFDGEVIEVLPVSAEQNGGLPQPGETPKFILDNHLGKLATYLRILGFDCLYQPELHDAELAELAVDTKRILLTRDRQLLMRKIVRFGCWIRNKKSVEQVRQVLSRYGLYEHINPFRRCLRCNHPLEQVPKKTVEHRLEPLTKKYYADFYLCRACDQIYWPGSHYTHMQALIDEVVAEYEQKRAGE